MKTLSLLIVCSMSLFCFTGVMNMHAVSPKQYIYDTKEVDGQVVSKVIFLQDNNTLTQQIKYEFSYNAEGRVSEKKALKWSPQASDWEPAFRITYTYDQDDIHSVYGLWDKKKKDFSLNRQSLVSPLSSYDEIFS